MKHAEPEVVLQQPRTSRVFFYGLFMDAALLRDKILNPTVIGPARLRDYRIHIAERATLIPSTGACALGFVMDLSNDQADALYSEPSVRDYKPEHVEVELVDSGATSDALCYNLPHDAHRTGSNPAYASKLSELIIALGLDAAYAEQVAAFAQQP